MEDKTSFKGLINSMKNYWCMASWMMGVALIVLVALICFVPVNNSTFAIYALIVLFWAYLLTVLCWAYLWVNYRKLKLDVSSPKVQGEFSKNNCENFKENVKPILNILKKLEEKIDDLEDKLESLGKNNTKNESVKKPTQLKIKKEINSKMKEVKK